MGVHHRRETLINSHKSSLLIAEEIGFKSSKYNFDWENYQQALYKVEEEWQELKEELGPQDHFNKERVFEELGDLLFSIVQLARHLQINPDKVLEQANEKFLNRFDKLYLKVKNLHKTMNSCSSTQLEYLWNEVKDEERT